MLTKKETEKMIFDSLINLLGWQGGTIHQVIDALKIKDGEYREVSRKRFISRDDNSIFITKNGKRSCEILVPHKSIQNFINKINGIKEI